jgi:hypothetical protein
MLQQIDRNLRRFFFRLMYVYKLSCVVPFDGPEALTFVRRWRAVVDVGENLWRDVCETLIVDLTI